MFKLFSRKTELDKLKIAYEKKLKEAYKMSTIDRKKSDSLTAEANEILDKIKAVEQG